MQMRSTSRILLTLLLCASQALAAPYKPQCRDAAGKLAQCVGTLDNSQAPTAIPVGTITGGSRGRLLYDTGTVAGFTAVGTTGWFLQSNGGTLAPTWNNTPVGWTISCASNTCSAVPTSALSGTVAVANGGTGKATWTANSIPVATGVTTIGEIAPGTAGQVLTSNGAGSPPSMQAPVTSNTASASAGTSQTLTTNAWTAITGASVSLAAGSYLCSANVRTAVQCSAGAGYISLKLYNVTGAADIANSERIGTVCATTGTAYSATTPITELVTVGTTSTIQIYAVSPAGATYTARDIYSDSDGRTRLVCVKTAS